MDTTKLLAQIRDGAVLTRDDLYAFGKALDTTQISDAQTGAFAMAVRLRGLSDEARVGLTEGMRDSGEVLSWELPGPVLDKHSTGGVGDPVSLLLAPALAACGVYVPMISGRGLGHTGGTLDKLEAIPGYISDIGPARLEHVVRQVGCAIVGASGRVAPADKRLYAIRDVTGTVASIDLITASILSKKLAAGLDGLVLDVKTGSGAFMTDAEQAENLAQTLVDVANAAGCPTSALITDMSEPLADAAGNALEIKAVMEVLTGGASNSPLLEATRALGGRLLQQAGLASAADAQDGEQRIQQAITSGRAVEIFAAMIAAMGGPTDFADAWAHCLPEATIQREVQAQAEGFVETIETTALGHAVVDLGGGRKRDGDRIDPAVGLSDIVRVGQRVEARTPLAMVHASTEAQADLASRAVRAAFQIGPAQRKRGQVILKTLKPRG
ncbi:MAG: thymidine phosphorylase [Pseudomonadota bacterium]